MTQRGKDVMMVMVDRFSKMAYFVPHHKTDDASYIVVPYFIWGWVIQDH